MSACEKCWHDAHGYGPYESISEHYSRLVDERKANPCTPEEQAGPDATACPRCNRATCHQHTGECMVATCDFWRGKDSK